MNNLFKKSILFMLIYTGSCLLSFAAEKDFSKDFALEFYEAWNSELTSAFRLKSFLGELRFSIKDDENNFGLSATSSKLSKYFPFYIKCGNLSAAGLLSKMNSPLLAASASPFSSSVSSASGLTASLPGYATFSRPVSLFSQLGIKQKAFSLEFCNWYSPEEGKNVISLHGIYSFGKKSRLEIGAGGGFFPYKEMSGTSWFLDSPYYPAGSHLSAIMHLSLNLPLFKSYFMTTANESPFGGFEWNYRAENKFIFEHSSFTSSVFYKGKAQADITASGKSLEPLLQLKENFSYKFTLNTPYFPVFVKNGLSLYNAFNLSSESHELKAGAGSQFLFPFMLLQFSVLANMTLETLMPDYFLQPPSDFAISFDGASLSLKSVFYCGDFSPGLTASLASSPDLENLKVTNTYKIAASLSWAGKSGVKVSCNSSFSLSYNNDEITKKNCSLTVTSAFVWKKIKCSCKLGFTFEG